MHQRPGRQLGTRRIRPGVGIAQRRHPARQLGGSGGLGVDQFGIGAVEQPSSLHAALRGHLIAIVSPGLLAPGLLVTITGALEAPGRRGPVAARHPHGSGGMLAGADAGHVRSQCLRIPNGRSHRLCWRSAIEVVSLAAAVTVAVGSS